MIQKEEYQRPLFIIYYDLSFGGIQRKIIDLVNYTASTKRYSSVPIHIILKRKSSYSIEHLLKNKYANLHYLPSYVPSRFSIFYLVYLCILVWRYKPQTVFLFMHQPLFYFTFIKQLFIWIPFRIVVSQDIILSCFNKLPYSFPYPKWWIHYVFYFSDRVIAPSQFCKTDLIQSFGIDKRKIVVIPNWVVRAPQKSKGRIYDIVYCGRFSQEKRLDRIITIFSEVKKVIPMLRTVLVGGGKEIGNIRTMISDFRLENSVHIIPFIDDVFTVLSKSKILILSSEFENFPMVVLEAMACGTVPIVLVCPGIEDLITNGVNGYYEESIELMRKKIIELLHNNWKRERMGENAKKTSYLYGKHLIRKTVNQLFLD